MDANTPTKWAIVFLDKHDLQPYLWVKRLGQGSFARADLVRDENGRLEDRNPFAELHLAKLTAARDTDGLDDQGGQKCNRSVGYWHFYNLGCCLDVLYTAKARGLYVPSYFAAGVMASCLRGLESLLTNGIAHNDLYPRNIFMGLEREGDAGTLHAVVGDLGQCRTLAYPASLRRVCDMKNDIITLNRTLATLVVYRRPASEVALIKERTDHGKEPLYCRDGMKKFKDEGRWWEMQTKLEDYSSRWMDPSTTIQTFDEGIKAFAEIQEYALMDFDEPESAAFNTMLQEIADENTKGVPMMFDSFDELRNVAELKFKGEIIKTVKICPQTFRICARGYDIGVHDDSPESGSD